MDAGVAPTPGANKPLKPSIQPPAPTRAGRKRAADHAARRKDTPMVVEIVETAVQRVDIGGRSLAVQIRGHGVPPVVLVSGLGMDRRQWRDVIPRLARWTTVLAYDRAGV